MNAQYGPDEVIDLSRMTTAEAREIIEQKLDEAPQKVNLFAGLQLVKRNDPDELAAMGAQWIDALIKQLQVEHRAVDALADKLDAVMALHHLDERSCDKWCDDICQVADDLRVI